MTLKQFSLAIENLMRENPDTEKMEAIFSKDDEGNEFKKVAFGPVAGYFESGEFVSEKDMTDSDNGFSYKKPNAVCIN